MKDKELKKNSIIDEKELKKIFNGKKYRVKKITSKKTGKVSEKKVDGFKKTKFKSFKAWFDESKFEDGCDYCGLTNDESFKLFKLRPKATRGGRRGKRLELDRKNPNEPYDDLNNVVWCCYWCNNAKSNFFTKDEFKPVICEAIGIVLKNILKK